MSKQVVIDAVGKHTASVFILHGLGDTAAGWTPLARSLAHRYKHIKWILPTAPTQPVTLNMGYAMPSWFDIKSLNPPPAGRGPSDEDEKGMLQSVSRINGLVRAEIDAGIPADRIIVGGFSQGGVISLLTAITSEYKLAGVVALSAFLGLSDKIASMQTEHAKRLPIFWGHGKADDVVRYEWAVSSVDKLKALKFDNVEFHSYDNMPHSFCPEEQAHLEAWLTKVLGDK